MTNGVAPDYLRETLVIIRTHYFDDTVAALQDAMKASGLAVALGCDESDAVVDVPADVTKISLTTSDVQDMKLFVSTGAFGTKPDFGWRCGDYILYRARASFPNYKHYMMIEPDVFINTANLSNFLDLLKHRDELDFIACDLRRAKPDWYWHSSLAPQIPDIWRCLFPFLRISGRALDLLLTRRQQLSAIASDNAELREKWPNDEVFVSSALQEAGYACEDFNKLGVRVYSPATLSFHHPFSLKALENKPADEMIYHPVLAGKRFGDKVDKLLDVAVNKRNIAFYHMFTAQLMKDVALECDKERHDAIEARLKASLREIGYSVTTQRIFGALKKLKQKISRG